jgi:apolipoprotein N-acyltransferase
MGERDDWHAVEAERELRRAEDERVTEAVWDALSEEEWHHIGRGSMFSAYFFCALVVLAVTVWQWTSNSGAVQWYTPVSVLLLLLAALGCAALWINSKVEQARLRKRLRKVRPDWDV